MSETQNNPIRYHAIWLPSGISPEQFEEQENEDYRITQPGSSVWKLADMHHRDGYNRRKKKSRKLSGDELVDQATTFVTYHLRHVLSSHAVPDFELRMNMAAHEALANVQRYLLEEHGPDQPPVTLEGTSFQVILHTTRDDAQILLAFTDTGPPLAMTPAEYAAKSVTPEGINRTHGKGFNLMREFGHFDVDAAPINLGQKVVVLLRHMVRTPYEDPKKRVTSPPAARQQIFNYVWGLLRRRPR